MSDGDLEVEILGDILADLNKIRWDTSEEQTREELNNAIKSVIVAKGRISLWGLDGEKDPFEGDSE